MARLIARMHVMICWDRLAESGSAFRLRPSPRRKSHRILDPRTDKRSDAQIRSVGAQTSVSGEDRSAQSTVITVANYSTCKISARSSLPTSVRQISNHTLVISGAVGPRKRQAHP